MNGHEIVAQTLKHLGITHIYSLSGGSIRPTLPACSHIGIRLIGVRHQQGAVLMAAAHNYRAGRLTAVAMVSAGPAMTNAVTGVLVAWENCWPLLLIAGTLPLSGPFSHRRGSFQALDGIPIFQSITKWATTISSLSQIPDTLKQGLQIASSRQPGPVYIELPERSLNASGPYPSFSTITTGGPIIGTVDDVKIQQASQMVRDSIRPAVVLGKGLRWTEPIDELRSLIETYQIPFITSPMGRGYLPDDHPLCVNSARDQLQEQADTIMILGARLNWTFRFGTQFSREAKLIHIDIVQEELVEDRPGSLGIQGEVKSVLQALLQSLQAMPSWSSCLATRKPWLKYLEETRKRQKRELEAKIETTRFPMSPHRLMKEVRDFLPRDAICVLDGRDTMAAAQEVLGTYEPASRYTAGTNGCMGIGIPFGIGAKICSPDRLVIVITGDMAFGISAMEMETAVRHKIPIIVMIVNNDGGCATSVHKTMYPAGHEAVAMYQPRLPYENIMIACGGYAESVERPEQIRPALQRAVTSRLPACLNVYVDPDAPFGNYLG